MHIRVGLSRRNFDRQTSFGRFWDGQRASKKRPKCKSAERSGWPSGTLPFGAFGRRFFRRCPLDPFFGLFRLFAVPSALRHGSFRKGPQMSELNSRPKRRQKDVQNRKTRPSLLTTWKNRRTSVKITLLRVRRTSFGRFWDGRQASKKRPKGKSAGRSGWPSGTLPFGAFGRRFFDAVPWTPFSAFSGFWTCSAVPSTLRHGSFRKGPQMSELNSRPKDVQKTSKTGKRDRLF